MEWLEIKGLDWKCFNKRFASNSEYKKTEPMTQVFLVAGTGISRHVRILNEPNGGFTKKSQTASRSSSLSF
jgi:hypothetical protein